MESIQTYKQTTFAKKFAGALLATTCLTGAASAVANADTIIEGTLPAPADFPNSAPGFLLPVGTTTVQGTLGAADSVDWFEFQGLPGGGSFSELATYTFNSESGVQVEIFNSSMTQLASAFLDGTGDVLIGTIPDDGDLLVTLNTETGSTTGYNVIMAAEIAPTPEPSTVATTGLALAAALAWRRKRTTK